MDTRDPAPPQLRFPSRSPSHGARRAASRRLQLPAALASWVRRSAALGAASLGLFTPAAASAASDCGGDGQRSCCVGEGPNGGGCEAGLTSVPGCSGDCTCSGSIFPSIDTCIAPSPCGGDGQRACCALEGSLLGGCLAPGVTLEQGCTGNCYCSNGVLGSSSSGHCRAVEPCGGPGERACCIGEALPSCSPGTVEVFGCQGDCRCEGNTGLSSIGTCVPVTPCGGPGQRACCSLTLEGANCADGLIEVAGCAGDCLCGGLNPNGDIYAIGTCTEPTPCGGLGQRECCLLERTTACDQGLVRDLGCSGDCFCGASITGVVDDNLLVDPLKLTALGTCVQEPVGSMAEPTIGFSDTGDPGSCSQLGYADMHMHLFGDIAHGGGVLAGQPCPRSDETYCLEAFAGQLTPGVAGPGQTKCGTEFCDAGFDVNDALQACYATDHDLVDKHGAPLESVDCPSVLADCGSTLFHGGTLPFAGHSPLNDAVGVVGTGDSTGSPLGAPVFNGWPQWSSTTHQQVYYKWLERAWRGGLRLMVQLAVNNTALCKSNNQLAGVDCDNTMAFIDQQLQAAYDLEHFIDLEVGNGTDNDEGWFRIVKTPAEARAELADGKLAVVLGVEVDHPFNCAFPNDQCTVVDGIIESCNMTANTSACRDPSDPSKSSADYVRDQVDYYYDVWGVRHMFPIHNFDNAFGGAATWQSAIEVGNRWVEGHWYNTRDCSNEGYTFKLGQDGTALQAAMSLFGFDEFTLVPEHTETASCNAFGLFPLGEVLIEQMMDRGMMIDVDHMSARSLDDTVALAQNYRGGGYPLAASHALFMDLSTSDLRHERLRTANQLAQIKAMGGMVGVMLKDDALDTDRRGVRSTLDYAPSGVTDDCRHSSKTFLQALSYAEDHMGTSSMGSDFDGIAGHFGPRFGSDACGGDPTERSAQLRTSSRLQYPFDVAPFGTFEKQVSGLKSFDYNVDGLAHVGLLPDFVADLAVVGATPQQLDPLMRSADAYVRMWELATGEQPKECDCADPDADGVEDCRDLAPADPNVSSVIADAGPNQILECTGAATSATLDGSASTGLATLGYAWAAPGVPLNASTTVHPTGAFPMGTTAVTLTVTDGTHQDTDDVLISVLDTVGPSLSVPADVFADICGSLNIGTATAVDTCGGAVTIASNKPASFKAGVTFVTWTAVDAYGNQTQGVQRVTVGLGDNAACCPAGSLVTIGTTNNDTLTGTAGVDCILGKGGQDTLKGLGANDLLSGGDGNDTLEGGEGNDLLQGGPAQDILKGQNGADVLLAGAGDDQCWGGAQDDTIFGGDGQDRLYGEADNDKLYGDLGDDRLEGSLGDDLLNGGANNDTCLPGAGLNVTQMCEVQQ